MVLYPDVQRKAQEEIDRVIGNDRLPTVADRELLPYIDALAKEVMRWHIVGPIGQVIRIFPRRMLKCHRI
jgi:cytochrome P450